MEDEMRMKVATIGNYVHSSVPNSNNEDDNLQIKTWHPEGPNAKVEKRDDILSHHEVMHRLDILDQERGPPCVWTYRVWNATDSSNLYLQAQR
jgi:seryl-tRNA synthetase